MRSHRYRRALWAFLILAALLGLAVFFGLLRPSSVAPNVQTPLSAQEMRELIPRGRELALAGDCFGCHSTPQGPKGAGGVEIATPFGSLFSTNITPDPEHGIGRYTRADFHRVLREGVAPGNRNLYPAMPYVFTHRTTPEDIDALYAYLMSIAPMPVPNAANTGVYRLPVRGAMNFWNLLNFPQQPAPQHPDRSAPWTRGAYLVEGLGHCAACHTPMNLMMGTDFSRSLQGNLIDGMKAPDIRAETLARQGFDVDALTRYLRTGISPQGTAFAGMYTVMHFSTSAMAPEDVEAMATYLLTDASGRIVPPASTPAPLPAPAVASPGEDLSAGRLTYASACAGCHGMAGEGIPNVAPAMRGNATLLSDDPHNFIKVVLNGLPTQVFPGGQRMYAMPPFSHELSDQDIADLTTWALAEWGGQRKQVTAKQVQEIGRAR